MRLTRSPALALAATGWNSQSASGSNHRKSITLPYIRRTFRLATALIALGWLGLMVYIWFWSRPHWGVGWALVGTINLTIAAVLAFGIIWLLKRALRRFADPS